MASKPGPDVPPTSRAAEVILLGPSRPALEGPGVEDGPATWRRWQAALIDWRVNSGHYTIEQATRLAYGEAVEAWCRIHPLPIDAARCSGCSRIHGSGVERLPDGARVHWAQTGEQTCLIDYGERRQRRAAEGLLSLGIAPPKGWST